MTDKNEDGSDKDAVAKAVAEATAGLKNKNDELLGKLKAKATELDDIKSRLDELDKAKEEAEAAAAEKAGDVNKIREQLESKHKREMEKLSASLDAEKSVNHKLLVDNGLTNALTEVGVSKDYLPAARALIQTSNSIELTDIDGQRVAQINGTSLTDHVAAWAQSDSGKHFVAAPANSGGGAQGAGGANGSTKTMSRAQFQELPPAKQSALSREGVSLTD